MALDRKEDSIFETIVGALDEMGAAFSSASDLEKAIWSATSLDATAAAKRDMVQIAAATHNTKDCQLVAQTLANRMRDEHWRFVSKALIVCEYCLENGGERFEYEIKKHMGTVRKLLSYKYIDEDGNDRGYQVRKQAKKFLQHLEGGRDDDFDVGYGGGYGGSGGRGGRGTYGDLDFDGPMGGGGGRSPPTRYGGGGGGGGGARVMRPDYEKEGTGLFSDDEEDGGKGRSDDDTPRMQTGRGRARRLSGEDKSLSPVRKPKDTSPPRRQAHKSPPRRQTSSSKAAHSASKDAVSTRKSTGSSRRADTNELASKLGAFSLAGAQPTSAASGGPRSVTPPTQNLLDDLDDDFGDFSTGPSVQQQPSAVAPTAFGGAAAVPLQPLGFGAPAPTASAAPRPAGMPMAGAPVQPRPMYPRTISPQAAAAPMQPTPVRPSAAPLQPMRTTSPAQQPPRPTPQQQHQKPVAGSGIGNLVNLDAHSLSKLGGQKRPEAPKKSAPLASLSSSSSSGWKS